MHTHRNASNIFTLNLKYYTYSDWIHVTKKKLPSLEGFVFRTPLVSGIQY